MDSNLKTEDMIYLRDIQPTETASDYLNKYIKAEVIPLANNTIADLKAENADLNTEIANLKIELAKKERDNAESAILKTNIEVRATMEEVRQAIAKIKSNENTAAPVATNDYEVTFKLDRLIDDTKDIQKTLVDVNNNVTKISDDIKNIDTNRIEEVVPTNISNIYPEANLVTNVEPAPVEIKNAVEAKEEIPTDIQENSVEASQVDETPSQDIVPNEIPTEENDAINNLNNVEETPSVNENVEENNELVSAGVNPEDKPHYDLPTDTIKPEENVVSSVPDTIDNNPAEENIAQAEGNNNIYPSDANGVATNTIEEAQPINEVEQNNDTPQVESTVEPTPTFDGEPYTPTGTKIGRSALEEVKKDIFVVKTPDTNEEISHFPQEQLDRLNSLINNLGMENSAVEETAGRSR